MGVNRFLVRVESLKLQTCKQQPLPANKVDHSPQKTREAKVLPASLYTQAPPPYRAMKRVPK